jgi:CheY-like chemotaxis protein
MSTAQAEARAGSVRRPGPLRILVVDDEPDTVITQAVRGLREVDPDVVIADISMPIMSGWDFARKVRQKMGEARPMLVAISGVYQKSSDKLLATMTGYEFFLTKPCDPAVVLMVVQKARGDGEV